MSVPAQITSLSNGITTKLYTPTFGKPFEDTPISYAGNPVISFQVEPKSLVSIIFALPKTEKEHKQLNQWMKQAGDRTNLFKQRS